MKRFVKTFLIFTSFALPGAFAVSEQASQQQWGQIISDKNPIAITQAVKQLDTQEQSHVVVIAQVDSICEVKGCWLSLIDPNNAETPNVRVRFKDYGFFVPPSLFGKQVKVEGDLQQVQLSLADSKHFVADGGGDPDTVTTAINELQLIATGVELMLESQ